MLSHISDVVHAARTLVKARGFTAVCVTSLGLGMGVVIAIMLLSRMLVGTPSGVKDDGLVELVIRPSGALRAQAGTAIIDSWSYPDYLDVRDAASGMVITGWSRGEGLVRLPDQNRAASVATMYVSSNYFSTVGVALARGPGFTAAAAASLAEAEAVIGHRVWQTRFGSDPNIIGRAITINQTEYVIVGVAPEGFRGHIGGLDDAYYQLWLPLSRHPRLHPNAPSPRVGTPGLTGAENVRLSRDAALVRVVARLSAGTTVAQADAIVQAAMSALAGRYPTSNRDKTGGVERYFPPGARLRSQVTFGRMVLFTLSAMVLLVVGLNISGMMLVRGAMRERELAIRLAMGASRWRLMRYHLSEAFVMAVFGGSVASALLFGVPVVVAWAFDFYGPELELFKPDAWLVLQCIALCFVTSLVLGLLPALRFSRPSLLSALKNDSAGSGRRVGRLQRLTAAAQAGLAVPFLVIGGIRVDQARVTALADLGFKPQGLYAARLNLAAVGKTENDRRLFVRTVEESLAQAPGVASVSVADGLPLDFIYRNTRVAREGESAFVTAHTTRIGTGYLETVGIRLLAGRTIDANDGSGAERVVLLSDPLARQLFPGANPIGERVVFALAGSEPQTYTVIGVTADLVSTQMGNPRPQLFVSLAQHPASTVLAIARGASADPSVRRAFENATSAADPDFVLGNLITGEGLIDYSYSDILTQGAVGSVAAGIALILAALGVYGVIAFMVTTRTREIGVRVALGASRLRVVREVLGEALRLVVPGIALGLVLAILWVRVADPSWYPLGGVEPLVYMLAAGVAFFVAALAGIPSARRAAAVEPMVAIRTE
jgi:putative ABC transport system permease protein